MQQYGSSDAGASLGDILGPAMGRARELADANDEDEDDVAEPDYGDTLPEEMEAAPEAEAEEAPVAEADAEAEPEAPAESADEATDASEDASDEASDDTSDDKADS